MSAAAPAASAQAPKEQYGRVKQVLSGDTIIIQGPSRGGPPPERTLSLSGISAPRLARRPNPKDPSESKDEPFAWESREFLRKLLVGKDIVFTVEYKVPSGREFGSVFVGPNKENVTQALVKEGLAAIREGSGKGGPSAQAVELAGIASGAQSAKKGIHGSPESLAAHVRNVVWNLENPRTLVDSTKGKPVDAVVESIRDGATLRVTLLPGHQNVTVVLSGIKTPTFKKVGDKDVPEPYAEEAKFFVETRLLQRDVKIVLEGVTGQNLLGTVLHPKGNISELLLENGYAKIVDWSFGNVSSGRERLRAAENTAKANKVRLWTDHKVSEKALIADRDFTAVVEEVVNPECVVVSHNGESKKVFLSSIRQPRPPKEEAAPAAAAAAPASAKKRQNYWEIPWMFEARDFMRKKLVGQKVQVHIDFIKPAADGFPTRVCATLKVGDINVAEALVSKGFATVVRYRESEEDRASGYDDLLAAEARAAKNLKGVHAQKDIPVHRINDVTTRAIAEKLLPSFTRAGRLQGVVEHVQSGSRLRVLIPKESSVVTLLLAGISCPRSGSADKPAEPYGDEALALTRSLALQHDVEVEIEEIDKNGAFVGHVYVGSTNLSAALLTNGYAKLHPSSERYKNSGTLSVAEAEAKNVRKNIWAGFVEPVAEVKQAEEEPRQRKIDYKSVLVTEVADTTTFWAQDSSASSQLDTIMQTISSAFEQNPPLAGAHTAKRGELLAAKFSADGQWYRARVLKVQGQSAIDVVYVDFGNKETLTNESIAALPSGVNSPALASEYRIGFLVAPPGEWAADALAFLRDSILNHTVSINVEYRDGPTEFVTVLDENNQDVGKELVEQGLMTFKARSSAHLAALMKEYGTAQQNAKATRQGIWMYGDISEDDAKEFGRGRP